MLAILAKGLETRRFVWVALAAAALLPNPCEAGWRHYWAPYRTAEPADVFPPPIVEYIGPLPPVIIYAPAHVYGARPYGIVRYNRPCLVSDGRSSYAVSCLSLAGYGFVSSYNGE